MDSNKLQGSGTLSWRRFCTLGVTNILLMTTPSSTRKVLTQLAIYVDDILLTGDDDVEMTALKAYLDDTFKIKDLGPIHWIEVLPTVGGLILT